MWWDAGWLRQTTAQDYLPLQGYHSWSRAAGRPAGWPKAIRPPVHIKFLLATSRQLWLIHPNSCKESWFSFSNGKGKPAAFTALQAVFAVLCSNLTELASFQLVSPPISDWYSHAVVCRKRNCLRYSGDLSLQVYRSHSDVWYKCSNKGVPLNTNKCTLQFEFTLLHTMTLRTCRHQQ